MAINDGIMFFGDAADPMQPGVINSSLRFDGSTHRMRKTWGQAATDEAEWTVSVWVKREQLDGGAYEVIFASEPAAWTACGFYNDQLFLYINDSGGAQRRIQTQRVFRDFSAWYHILAVFERGNGTAAEKLRLYVNGEEIPAGEMSLDERSSIGGSADPGWNKNGTGCAIGARSHTNDSLHFHGYMAEFHNIDGQALTPSSFTQTVDGALVPKEYTGTYGNNGFYLPFGQSNTAGVGSLNTVGGGNIIHTDSSSYDIAATDDFCIEFWFMSPDLGGDGFGSDDYGNFMGEYATGGPHFSIGYDFRSEQDIYFYTGNGAAFFWQVADNTMKDNEWNHIAIQRDGTTLRCWINGTRNTSITDAASNTGYTISSGKSTDFNKAYDLSEFNIGDHNNGNRATTGWISNVRLVVGDGNNPYADSDSNITVPTSTLTAITGTKLLSCTSDTLGDDISTENNDATNNGAVVSKLSPFSAKNFWEDSSGNDNHWNFEDFEYYDVMPDSPENNFATLNREYHSSSQAVLSEGNLKADTAGFVNAAHGYGAISTFVIPKDKKIYIEVQCTDGTSDNWFAGFAAQPGLESGPSSTNVGGANSITVYNRSVFVNGTETDYGSSAGLGGLGVANLSAGDILGCAIDGATGKVWLSRNGTYFKSPSTNDSGTTGDPAGGSNQIGTITNGTTEDVFFVLGGNTSVSSIIVNFGQDSTFRGATTAGGNADGNGVGDFKYAPPTSFLALCSSNLTAPDIGPNASTQADDHFNAAIWNGNGSNNAISGLGHQPDLIWTKDRNGTESHVWLDSSRGATKRLNCNTNGTESSDTNATLSSFDSDGFTLTQYHDSNQSTSTNVGWCWKANGGTTTTNDASATGVGSIDSVYQANTDAGFSIVTYEGTGSEGTVAHGLTAAPEVVIIKNRDSAREWAVYHKGAGNDGQTYLSTSDAFSSNDGSFGSTTPTSTVFNVNSDQTTNESGDSMVAWCFHGVEGYSKFGYYEGVASTDGAFVYTGFKPRLLICKNLDSAGSWIMFDSKRHTKVSGNIIDMHLMADTNATEGTDDDMDFLSNGFKGRRSSTSFNSGHTFIYLAWADVPFKYARGF